MGRGADPLYMERRNDYFWKFRFLFQKKTILKIILSLCYSVAEPTATATTTTTMEPPLRRQSSSLWNLTPPRISSNVATNIRNLPQKLGATSSYLFSTGFLVLGGLLYFYFYYGDVDRDGKKRSCSSTLLFCFFFLSLICLSLSAFKQAHTNIKTYLSSSKLIFSFSLSLSLILSFSFSLFLSLSFSLFHR